MVSLILTTMNEEETIPALLDGVFAQTRRPDEFVVVDAGSRDRTTAVLESYRSRLAGAGVELRLMTIPGANIARGRNEAIASARGDVVAVTDAGCRLEPSWLERIVEPLVRGGADLVGGFFRPVAHDRLQAAVASLTTSPTPPPRFLPSSRSVAFTKALWSRVGGYPEWLRWGEDTLFDMNCLRAGARYVCAPDAIVHWEVRRDRRGIALQHFRYAYGDAVAGTLSRSHIALQLVWWASLLGGALATPWLFCAAGLFPVAWMIRRRAMRLKDALITYEVALMIHAARFGGFAWGTLRRLTNRRSA